MSEQESRDTSCSLSEASEDVETSVNLKQIQNGTAYLFEQTTSAAFLKWWTTTSWAIQLQQNQSQPSSIRSEKMSDPRWNSNI